MMQLPVKQAASPDLLPWQAALMVLCVTAAGLFHEHPGAVRPLVSSLGTTELRSGITHAAHPADLLNAALLPR